MAFHTVSRDIGKAASLPESYDPLSKLIRNVHKV